MEKNNNILKVMLKSIGGAALIFLLLNVISFAILMINAEMTDAFTFEFDNGSFYYNSETNGPVWGTSTATFILFVSFCALLFKQLRNKDNHETA